MREWMELSIEVGREHADAMANFLFEQGSAGVEEQERGDQVGLRAYFETEAPVEAVRAYGIAIGAFDDAREPSLAVQRIDDEDWADGWRVHFQPLEIGERLFVCPPWTDEFPTDKEIVVIHPGMAFGTGQHATTKMCLELCEAAIDTAPVAAAIDLGCGSGILGIALAKLGAGTIHAVDNDPLACEAALSNAQRNGVETRMTTHTSLEGVGAADLLVANLFTSLLVDMACDMAARVHPGGTMICSGFIEGDAEKVIGALTAAGFVLQERRDEAPWVALRLRRS